MQSFIGRNHTNIIKGVALIFMFILHFFCWPEWYIKGVKYPELATFATVFRRPLDICVALFAFMTGYCYFFAKNKSFRYSLRKMSDIWIVYAAIFLCLLFPAVVMGNISLTVVDFIKELFAVNLTVMYFCWYVLFYVMTMLILPLFVKIVKGKYIRMILIGIVFPWVLARGYAQIIPFKIEMVESLLDELTWFSVVTSGYMFAELELFDKVTALLKNKCLTILLANVMIVCSFMGRYIFPYLNFGLAISMDFLYAPMFIWGLITIAKFIPQSKLWIIVQLIGKYSLEMWFFSCAFFNCCKGWSQKILYFPQNPILVLAWGGGMCLSASILIRNPIHNLQERKNKVFFLGENINE